MVVPLERLINMNTQKFKNINSFNLNVRNTQFVQKIAVRRVDYHFFSLLEIYVHVIVRRPIQELSTSIWLVWPLSINSESVVLSTNLWIMQSVLRSSIKTIKVSGPNRDPYSSIDPDNCIPSLTRCWRSVRKEQIQRIKTSGTSKLINLRTTVEWSTWSKALA